MSKKNASGSRKEALQAILSNHNGNDGRVQRQRLGGALLALHSLTTIEARKYLDILAPAARIWELIHREGWKIGKAWERVETNTGRWHRVARYFLIASPVGEGDRRE